MEGQAQNGTRGRLDLYCPSRTGLGAHAGAVAKASREVLVVERNKPAGRVKGWHASCPGVFLSEEGGRGVGWGSASLEC